MAKSKWPEVKEKLTLIEAWCRDGLIEIEIVKKLGISKATMEVYKKEHLDFQDTLKRGKEVIDYEVEQKLLKRAMGYEYTETTSEQVLNPLTKKYELSVTKTVVKHLAPDTTAQIFWLKNRKPKEWRDKQEIDTTVNGGLTIKLEGEIADWAK